MDATLIVIDSDAELARARALVDRLWESEHPADIARLHAQARLIAAYEESKWPRRPASTAELIRHLMDQHGLTPVIRLCLEPLRRHHGARAYAALGRSVGMPLTSSSRSACQVS
jgi:hypothetical protein